MRTVIAVLLALAASGTGAAELLGLVVRVADGDTITVIDADRVQHVVRLAGIDAPERGQPFSQVSRRHLSELVHGRQVAVHWSKIDRYGRLVGRVQVHGRDANLAQVEVGLAWWFRKYAHEQPAAERDSYAAAERDARAHALGLWRDAAPLAPWDHRRKLGISKTSAVWLLKEPSP
jgi:endonuclease YncB( thermonuclease family)